MIIKFKKKFDKSYNKLDKKIQIKFKDNFRLFQINPLDKSLNNHSLTGEYLGCRSINITGNYRAIFKEYGENKYEFVDFIDIGTHSELYG